MPKSTVTDETRLALANAYLRELETVCETQYGGDYDKMPPGVKVDWTKVVRRSRLRGVEPHSAAIIVGRTGDEIWDQTT
jgi:hypothetical protein